MKELKVGMYVRTTKGKIYKFKSNNSMARVPYMKCYGENIIDLIEVGDYVNGYKVTYIDNDSKTLRVDAFNWGTNIIENEDIKSVVTKEQFNSIKYEVE